MFPIYIIFICIWNTHCSSHVVYHYKSMAMEGTQVRQVSALPPSDSEEQRKIAEGADALLNLAGISTRKRMQSTALYPPGISKEICVKVSFWLSGNYWNLLCMLHGCCAQFL